MHTHLYFCFGENNSLEHPLVVLKHQSKTADVGLPPSWVNDEKNATLIH